MLGKITKTSVDRLQRDGDKDVTLWDTEVKGFGLRARSGGKFYMLRYRQGVGRGAPIRTIVIGRHGSPWSPDSARDRALYLLGTVKGGANPAAAISATKMAPTVAELLKRFLNEHVKAKRKSRTADEYGRLVEKIVNPALGKKRVPDITRQDISRLHHSLRATPYQANRTLAMLRKAFNLAEQWGERPDGSNPCRHVTKFPEKARERMLTGEELAALGETLAAAEAARVKFEAEHAAWIGGGKIGKAPIADPECESASAVAAIRILIFTGARMREILGLKWSYIDTEHGEARLPDSKTGAKTIHLPPPALAVLDALPRFEANPYVIVGAKVGACLVNLEKSWYAIRDRATVRLWRVSPDPRVAGLVAGLWTNPKRPPTIDECRAAAGKLKIALPAGLTDVRIHDLRHAFASVAASSGMALPIIGKMLGHSQAATTQRYAHLARDPVAAAAATVAGRIADAMGMGTDTRDNKGSKSNVIGLGRR